MDVGNLISGSSAFSKFSLYIWKFLDHPLLKASLKDFEHDLLACKMNAMVWYFEHSLTLSFFGIRTKTTFSSLVATAEFSKFADTVSTVL